MSNTNDVPWQDLDTHTTEFTDKQRDDVIEKIVQRAVDKHSVRQPDRLRKAILCAHQAKPIRLIDLLFTCNADFPTDVVMGIYRHYDPTTDTMRGGWTAQHSEPHDGNDDFVALLLKLLGE